MTLMNRHLPYFIAGMFVLASLLIPTAAATAAGPIRVAVSIAPQAYFAEKIGGSRVQVSVVLSPGQSPHTFEPSPRTAVALAESDIYFHVGMAFEDLLTSKIPKNTRLKIVKSIVGIPLLDEKHDPHIWMDPRRMKMSAARMATALKDIDPDGAADYDQGLARLIAELDDLDGRVRGMLGSQSGKRLYVFHAAYSYFADAYGLTQVALEADGKEPSPKRLAWLVEQAKADGVTTVFSEPQSSDKSARALAAAIGAQVVTLDPLAKDYTANMLRIADAVARALAGQRS